jgi:hypothetical protein
VTNIITEELVQLAFDWLNQAPEHVAAKRVAVMAAQRKIRRLEKAEKRVMARLCRSMEGSVESRKWAALCHSDLEKAEVELDKAEAEAEERVGEWEAVLDQREKCKMVIEAWRTQSATNRGSRF